MKTTDSGEQITRKVHEQYEELPYPARDPADERKRLRQTHVDNLTIMNHYCFKGRRDFTDGFRALVAGGGTGDSTIYLAEQLKHTNAAVTYIDISRASLEIARKRAEVRCLENITFINGSLLDLPTMSLPKFDYINCSGVLHHLADPDEGLRALRSVLKDDGAMALMVYGKYGRTSLYHIQELMRIINTDRDGTLERIANTRTVLASLPETNWYKRAATYSTDTENDAGLYDLFLHSRDKPYTVSEVYELIEPCGINLVTFIPETRMLYKPQYFIRDKRILDRILAMPLKKQQAVGELLSGAVAKHEFYACCRTDTVASIDEMENIPVGNLIERKNYADNIASPTWTFKAPPKPALTIKPKKPVRAAFGYMDGNRSLAEVYDLVARDSPVGLSMEKLKQSVKAVFNIMLEWGDLILLRAPGSKR